MAPLPELIKVLIAVVVFCFVFVVFCFVFSGACALLFTFYKDWKQYRDQ